MAIRENAELTSKFRTLFGEVPELTKPVALGGSFSVPVSLDSIDTNIKNEERALFIGQAKVPDQEASYRVKVEYQKPYGIEAKRKTIFRSINSFDGDVENRRFDFHSCMVTRNLGDITLAYSIEPKETLFMSENSPESIDWKDFLVVVAAGLTGKKNASPLAQNIYETEDSSEYCRADFLHGEFDVLKSERIDRLDQGVNVVPRYRYRHTTIELHKILGPSIFEERIGRSKRQRGFTRPQSMVINSEDWVTIDGEPDYSYGLAYIKDQWGLSRETRLSFRRQSNNEAKTMWAFSVPAILDRDRFASYLTGKSFGDLFLEYPVTFSVSTPEAQINRFSTC